MSRKIKIIHVIYSFEVGGIESLITGILNSLDYRKFECHLLILTNDKIKLVKSLDENVMVHTLPVPSNKIKTFFGLFIAFTKITQIFNTIKADIVHTHITSFPLLFVSLALKISSKCSSHIRTVHTTGLFFDRNTDFKNLVKFWADRFAMIIKRTRIISVSRLVYLKNISFFSDIAEDIICIRNGINISKFDKTRYNHVCKSDFGVSDGSLVLSYVARLSIEKNHLRLVEIWPDVIAKVPNAVLFFAGSGEMFQTVQQEVEQLGLQDKIILLGAIDNVPELLAISDVGLFVSEYEGFGLVLVENFAMGVPVIASNIDSFRDIITHGENGLLVDLENRRKFVENILDLCTDERLRSRMAIKANLDAQEYRIDKMVQEYSDYYEKISN